MSKPVYLEDIPDVMSLEEVPQEILVKNPGERTIVITPEESGWNEEQVFTSECLPDIIPYKLLGFIKFPDGNAYPKYRANVVTYKKLGLKGQEGYENGISIIDKIAWVLTWQEKMFEAKSIAKSDLRFLDYEKEEFSYWVTSTDICVNEGNPNFDFLENGNVFKGFSSLLYSDGYWNADNRVIKPVMIMKSKIKISSSNITWIEI